MSDGELISPHPSPMVDELNTINGKLTKIVQALKRSKFVVYLVNCLLLILVGYALLSIVSIELISMVISLSIIGFAGFWWQWRDASFAKITRANLLEHYNREFAYYQESAQLALEKAIELSPIARLQRDKVIRLLYADAISGKLDQQRPKFSFALTRRLVIIAIIVIVFTKALLPVLYFGNHSITPNQTNVKAQDIAAIVTLKNHSVHVTPPKYTGIAAYQSDQLNLQVAQDASVEWQFEFSDPALNYYLVMGEDSYEPLIADTSKEPTTFRLALSISTTTLYRLVYEKNGERFNLPGVYSIAVQRDQPPKIKLIKPVSSLVEIQPTEMPQFTIETLISDDYGISDVSILASVAKGSGEAVKFRDETFRFDQSVHTEQGEVYSKQWQLTDLEMQPGDEVYFSVLARDNHSPETQQSKSSSVIVRWLDVKSEEIAAEGIQIRFKPEYFRSQRQIIIETEQLIADRKDLGENAVEEKSVDLGHSQRNLKEKYGQYLGDEVGDGPGDQFGLADGYHGGENHNSGEASAGVTQENAHKGDSDNHQDNDSQHQDSAPEAGHLHQEMVDSNDKSGASELIARFAHNHGSVEIGPMSSRDPKSWMKKAVGTMWQAELHLMLSEPEKALPFEYEAYRYLKMARQAEKIYVKRLGFEPPPVSESNRLTGELDDIDDRHWVIEDTPQSASDQFLFSQVYRWLTLWPAERTLLAEHKSMLQQLRARLLILAEARPILIDYAATVERILIKQALTIDQCEQCIVRLKQKLWQLVEDIQSLPSVHRGPSEKNISNLKSYLEAVDKLTQIPSVDEARSMDSPKPNSLRGKETQP